MDAAVTANRTRADSRTKANKTRGNKTGVASRTRGSSRTRGNRIELASKVKASNRTRAMQDSEDRDSLDQRTMPEPVRRVANRKSKFSSRTVTTKWASATPRVQHAIPSSSSR